MQRKLKTSLYSIFQVDCKQALKKFCEFQSKSWPGRCKRGNRKATNVQQQQNSLTQLTTSIIINARWHHRLGMTQTSPQLSQQGSSTSMLRGEFLYHCRYNSLQSTTHSVYHKRSNHSLSIFSAQPIAKKSNHSLSISSACLLSLSLSPFQTLLPCCSTGTIHEVRLWFGLSITYLLIQPQ